MGDRTDPREVIIVGLVCGCVIWTMAPATGNMAMSRCHRCGELGSYTRWIERRQGQFWLDDGEAPWAAKDLMPDAKPS